MGLYQAWLDFSDQLDMLLTGFEEVARDTPPPFSAGSFGLLTESKLEGLVSRAWQAWCLFCRAVVVESCVGTIDGNGVVIPPLASATSDPHVSHAAIQAKSKRTAVWGGVNAILRLEPTWGDTDVLATIVPRLKPTNHAQLSSAFSTAHKAAKTLQTIRNAAAHSNVQTLNEVGALMPSYLAYPVKHSTHALYWVGPTTSKFLIVYAIEDLRDSALSAIS